MPLTPAIKTFLDKQPDLWAAWYCWQWIRSEASGAPAGVCHKEAIETADVRYYGLEPDAKGEGRPDVETWLRGRVDAVWAVYEVQWETSQDWNTEFPYQLDHLGRDLMIRRAFAKWRGNDAMRSGRDPQDCVMDQVRGAFFVARQYEEDGSAPMRLDPEYVLETRGKGCWPRAKGFAVAWWAHKAVTAKNEPPQPVVDEAKLIPMERQPTEEDA